MQRERLENLVSEFRAALQELVSSGNDFNMFFSKNYPSAACDNSSMLLAAYLSDNGFPGALRVFGDKGGKGELGGHVWLKLDNLVIDITGSQFEAYDQDEIVIAEESAFLSTFEVSGKVQEADWRKFPTVVNRGDFRNAHDAILARIASNQSPQKQSMSSTK